MRYDLGHPSREPVLWSSIVKDGLVIIIGGLTVFGVFVPTEEQYAWLLTAFGFVSVVVAMGLREIVWSGERVEEELLDAETVIMSELDLHDETDIDTEPISFGDIIDEDSDDA